MDFANKFFLSKYMKTEAGRVFSSDGVCWRIQEQANAPLIRTGSGKRAGALFNLPKSHRRSSLASQGEGTWHLNQTPFPHINRKVIHPIALTQIVSIARICVKPRNNLRMGIPLRLPAKFRHSRYIWPSCRSALNGTVVRRFLTLHIRSKFGYLFLVGDS